MTNWLIASVAEEVLGETESVTVEPEAAPTRFRVTQEMAPETVFEALEMEMPSTVSEAFVPAAA